MRDSDSGVGVERRRGARPLAVRLIAGLLLVASLGYIAMAFDWPAIGRLIAAADWPWLVGAGTVSILCYWLVRALRWGYLLSRQGIRIPLLTLYWYSAIALSVAILTPMQSGEVLKIELLRRRGALRRLHGYASFFVERIADLAVVTALSLLALLAGLVPLVPRIAPGTAAAAVAVLVLIGASLCALPKVRIPCLRLLEQARHAVPDLSAAAVLLGLTLVGWLCVIWGWHISLAAIGIHLSAPEATALTSTVTLVNVLSMIPGAVGVSEISAALMLSGWESDTALTQAGALVLRLYALINLTLGALHLALRGWVLKGEASLDPPLSQSPDRTRPTP